MTTTTTTHRSPRLLGATTATIAAGLALTLGFQATDHLTIQDHPTQSATHLEQETPIADLGEDQAANPLRVLSDPTPVVSAHMSVAAATANPFEVMSDLTPVISAHPNAPVSTIDPFQEVRDLTPIVSALRTNIDE